MEIAVPFRISSEGGVATMDSPVDIAIAHIISVVNTRKLERLMRPTYGTRVQDMVFAALESVDISMAKSEIREALLQDAPDVTIHSVELVESDDGTGRGIEVDVSIGFSVPPSDNVYTYTFPVAAPTETY